VTKNPKSQLQTLRNQVSVLPELSDLDSRILKELLRDGRVGYDELAMLCKASRNKIWKRYKALEKKGIVKGATTQVNFMHLGYAAMATLLISIRPQEVEQAMDFIGKIKDIQTYRQYNSLYNVRAVTTLENLHELDQVKQGIRQKLPIANLKTYLWTGIINIPENLKLNDTSRNKNKISQKTSLTTSASKEEKKIDSEDKKLIQILTKNGRMSFTKIAKEMKLATNTIVRRYNNLRNNGTIKVVIQIDPKKIGYCTILDFHLAFTSYSVTSQSIVEYFSRVPDIIVVTKTSGDYDLQVTAMVKDIDQMFALQDEISKVPSVSKFEVSARKIPELWPPPQEHISTI
jgi:Lrp/AsnC family transcriptional regulator for asnA, asnC and gidA